MTGPKGSGGSKADVAERLKWMNLYKVAKMRD